MDLHPGPESTDGGGAASEMSFSETMEAGRDSDSKDCRDAEEGYDGGKNDQSELCDDADPTSEMDLSNERVTAVSPDNSLDLDNNSKPLSKTGPEPKEIDISNHSTAAGESDAGGLTTLYQALKLHHGNEGSPQTLCGGVGIQSNITAHSSNVMAPHLHNCNIKQLNINMQNLTTTSPKKSTDALKRTVLEKIKLTLKKKSECIFEGMAKQGNPTAFMDVYTELYITDGGTGNINTEHEVRKIELISKKLAMQEAIITCTDIFKPFGRKKNPVRSVLTKGIAGIGKTVSIQKFILDWAEGKANTNIEVIFSLPFRELNLMKDQEFSLLGLLQHYHPDLNEVADINLNHSNVVFILDGLDECQLPLAFQSTAVWCDITKSTTVDVLLTSLIKGDLLPFALLWVTTRPAAANRIPAKCIHQVTEIQGFSDSQKEQYFRNKFKDVDLATRVIDHMKSSRTLYIMCHIPVFCWISATVLEHILGEADCVEVPKTLTQMYTHFLLVLTHLNKQKYSESQEMEVDKLMQSEKEVIMKLGELAWEQLKDGKLIFYERELSECGIDVDEASIYSGVFTQIFKEEYGLYKRKMFCFVHLSIQEYLAALHLFNICTQREVEGEEKIVDRGVREEGDSIETLMLEFYKGFVEDALKSESGHLDLCLRFLFGLLLDTSQGLLQDLLTWTGSESNVRVKMIKYLKRTIRKKLSPERSINLFHCLNELNDNSFTEEIQFSLMSGSLSSENLAPDQCSALAYEMLMKEDALDVFDLKAYKTNKEGYKRLLPIVKTCKRATLCNSELTSRHCRTLVSALRMPNSHLTELDLNSNSLKDDGLRRLCTGLRSRHCRLQILNLSNNGLSDSSVRVLCARLKSPHCELRSLDLSRNGLRAAAIRPLSDVLRSPHCKLQTLILRDNNLDDSAIKPLCIGLTSQECKLEVLDLLRNKVGDLKMLCSALSSPHCKLHTLDLSCNNVGDEGVKQLCLKMMSPNCRLQKLGLRDCNLTALCCADLATVLQSHHSELRDLELRDNDLEDSGVGQLSAGMQDPSCKLQRLGLSGCRITEDSCRSLASALRLNPSHLKELDLSYNHLGDSGVRALSAGLEEPSSKLESLCVDHGGECRNKPGLWKYGCHLTLDPDTAHRNLSLSKGGTKVTLVQEEHSYPNHPKRFKDISQVLCRQGLSKTRCYWEVEWNGCVGIGVAYGNIHRKGESEACMLGGNDKSWCLLCNYEEFDEEESEGDSDSESIRGCDSSSDSSDSPEDDFEDDKSDDSGDNSLGNSEREGSFLAVHNKKMTVIATRASNNDRVGVHLDWLAGTLSFYKVSFDEQTLLHTFHTTFTQPLYPGFVLSMDDSSEDSSEEDKDWISNAGLALRLGARALGLDESALRLGDPTSGTYVAICQCE